MILSTPQIAAPKAPAGRRLCLAIGTAMAAMMMGGSAQAQINQALGYEFSQNGFEQIIAATHEVSGASLGAIDFAVSQFLRYNLTENGFEGYEANVDLNDDKNLFANLFGTYETDTRGLGGFVENRFAQNGFSVGVSANGNVDWVRSTFGDEGFLDPDFDFTLFTEEELNAVVWVRSLFVEGRLDIEVDPVAAGPLRFRPGLEAGISHSDFLGFGYQGAAAVGLSLVPNEEADDEFFFEESNLTFDHAGASFGALDGELVLGAGRDEDGLFKLAALVFKSFDPTDTLSFSLDALGSLDYTAEDGVRYADATLRLGAEFMPNDNWGIEASASVEHARDEVVTYSGDLSVDYTRFARFQPYVQLSGSYSSESQSLSLPVGFNGDIGDKLLVSLEVSPTYSRFAEEEAEYDLEANASLTLLAPPLLDDGLDSEFTITGSGTLVGGERSLSITGKAYF